MKRLAAISLLVVISLTLVTAQVSKTPFAIADLYRIQSVADPQVSPEGAGAFTVTISDMAKGTTNSDVYVVNMDGTGLHRLTASINPTAPPLVARRPDALLFVSTRADGAQLWLLPADGGEPTQLTRPPPASPTRSGRPTENRSSSPPRSSRVRRRRRLQQADQDGLDKGSSRPGSPTTSCTAIGPATGTASASTP